MIKLHGSVELAKEGTFEFTTSMPAGFERLKNLIQSLKQEGPKFSQGAIVASHLASVSCVVVIRPYHLWPIQLRACSLAPSMATGTARLYLNQLGTIFTKQLVGLHDVSLRQSLREEES